MNSQQYSKLLSTFIERRSELVFAVAFLARNQWMLVSEVPDGYGDRDVMIEEDFSNTPAGKNSVLNYFRSYKVCYIHATSLFSSTNEFPAI